MESVRGARGRRVVIVGGGVVGCAIAFELARAGMDVTLVERDGIAAHASGRNAGNVNPLHGSTSALLPVALEAFRIHAEVRAALSSMGCGDFALAPVERLFVGFDESERAGLEGTARLFESVDGFSARWLEPAEVRRRSPRLPGDVAFAVDTTGSLSLDGAAFTRSLAEAAARLGATMVRATVSGVESRGDRIVAIRTHEGAIPCDEVVLATGPWIADTEAWLGVAVPVRPVKGEILLVRLPGGPLFFDLTWSGVALYRRGVDQMWIGATASEEGFDCSPTSAAREMLMRKAARALPEIVGAEVLDQIVALRPVATPNAPIVRPAPGWRNATLANGGGSKGMLLCVGIGRTVRQLLTDPATLPPESA